MNTGAGRAEHGPVISRIELTHVFVPFRGIVREAMALSGGLGMAIAAEEPWTGGDFVICRLVADDGTQGLGEVMLWLPETGATPGQVISVIRDALAPYVLGESPFDIEHINHRMEINATRNEVAKGLLDMACYDMMGRAEGVSASEVMGGRQVDRVPLAALVPLMEAQSMAWLALAYLEGGVNSLRCKLGRGVEEDVRIIEAVRDAVGGDVRLRVDYNQAYSVDEAVAAITAVEPFGIDFAEQPVDAGDYIAMAQVQKRVETPLMAHEGCFSMNDIRVLAELGAIGVVGINTERPGGVTRALEAIEFAGARGMGACIHNQTLGIASAAQLHIAAARHSSLGHSTELFGHVMLEDDLIIEEIDYSGGSAAVPDGPGWGVELDEEALSGYASGPTAIMER